MENYKKIFNTYKDNLGYGKCLENLNLMDEKNIKKDILNTCDPTDQNCVNIVMEWLSNYCNDKGDWPDKFPPTMPPLTTFTPQQTLQTVQTVQTTENPLKNILSESKDPLILPPQPKDKKNAYIITGIVVFLLLIILIYFLINKN